MKKQSRTVPRRRQSVSPTPRHLPLVDILIDTQAELQELVVVSGLKVLEAMLEEDSGRRLWATVCATTCAPGVSNGAYAESGRVCAPTRAVEPPRVRRVIRRAVDARLPGAAPAARCAGPGGHA